MKKLLHILKSEPDDMVTRLIEAISAEEGASVALLYRDNICGRPVDWLRLVDDIFDHEKIICWW
jgi:hypothetical protein